MLYFIVELHFPQRQSLTIYQHVYKCHLCNMGTSMLDLKNHTTMVVVLKLSCCLQM